MFGSSAQESKDPHNNQLVNLEIPTQKANGLISRSQMLASEAKVAKAGESICRHFQSEAKYDAQGIATLELTENDVSSMAEKEISEKYVLTFLKTTLEKAELCLMPTKKQMTEGKIYLSKDYLNRVTCSFIAPGGVVTTIPTSLVISEAFLDLKHFENIDKISFKKQLMKNIFEVDQTKNQTFIKDIQKNIFKSLFPDHLNKDMVIHFHSKDAIQIPPFNYMLQQQARSYCAAAREKFKMDLHETEIFNATQINNELQFKIQQSKNEAYALASQILENEKKNSTVLSIRDSFYANLGETDEHYDNLNKIVETSIIGEKKKKPFEQDKEKLDTLIKFKATLNKNFYDKLNSYTQELMEEKQREMLMLAYDKYHSKLQQQPAIEEKTNRTESATPLSRPDFGRQLIEYSVNKRPNHSTFTFKDNENDLSTFAYDEGANVPAHARTLHDDCSNSGWVYGGVYDKNLHFSVTNSFIKHASLPPIDSFDFADELDILIKTFNNAKQVIEKIVKMRLHGGAPKDQEMIIDWNYLLLTTNVFNNEGQATAYGYIAKAMQLINQLGLEIDGVKVKIHASVFNAGINFLADKEMLWKTDTQQTENCHAYIHTTNILNQMANAVNADLSQVRTDRSYSEVFAARFAGLQKILPPASPDEEAYIRYEKELADLKDGRFLLDGVLDSSDIKYLKKMGLNNGGVNFSNFIMIYQHLQEKRAILEKQSNQKIPHVAYQAIYIEIQKTNYQLSAVKDRMNLLLLQGKEPLQKRNESAAKIEKYRKQHWDDHKKEIFQNIMGLKENDQFIKTIIQRMNYEDDQIKNQATDVALSLAAFVYKAYMDDLYYSGKYHTPKYAAMFNSYSAAYQRLTGMATSLGCKSANDRTYVIRLLIAAMQADHLNPSPIPAACHEDDIHHELLVDRMNKIAMNDAAMYSCIDDNRGTPKVSGGKFGFLKKVLNIDSINKFSGYAAHKMKSFLSKFEEYLEKREKELKKQEKKALKPQKTLRIKLPFWNAQPLKPVIPSVDASVDASFIDYSVSQTTFKRLAGASSVTEALSLLDVDSSVSEDASKRRSPSNSRT